MNKLTKDPREVCRLFNEVRQEMVGRRFPSSKMIEIMKERCDLGKSYFWEMVKNGFFEVYKDNKRSEYHFTYSPIHYQKFDNLFNNFRKQMRNRNPKHLVLKEEISGDSIQAAISLLKREGYIILRDDGVDESKLKAEMPEIYKKYQVLRTM